MINQYAACKTANSLTKYQQFTLVDLSVCGVPFDNIARRRFGRPKIGNLTLSVLLLIIPNSESQ